MRTLFYDLLTLVFIALLGAFAVAGLGMAQPPGLGWTRAADGCNWHRDIPGTLASEQTAMACISVSQYSPTNVPQATPPDLCGRIETRGTTSIRVQCVDYPALRKLTGSTMFPDAKGQQVWVRSTDPTTKAFRIAMTYRKAGHLDTIIQYADVHETYDSGASWVLGDVTIVAVEVTELRESAKAELR